MSDTAWWCHYEQHEKCGGWVRLAHGDPSPIGDCQCSCHMVPEETLQRVRESLRKMAN